MKACALALLASSVVFGADDLQLAVALKAQSAFERVELTARPRIPDADVCLQAQAAALALAPPEERSLLYYRKGYCSFAEAGAAQSPAQFLAAATEFDKAIEAWPLRMRKGAKHPVAEPVSAPLRVFAAIARLHTGADPAVVSAAQQEIAAALESSSCTSNLMPAALCGKVLSAGAQWQGWFALRDNNLDDAWGRFSGNPSSGWTAWVRGRQDFNGA